MHLFGKAIVVLLLVNQTFAVKASYTGLQEVEDTVRDAPYERLGSESYHPREAQMSSDDKPLATSYEDHRTNFESDSLSNRTVKTSVRQPVRTKLMNMLKCLGSPFRYLHDKIAKMKTRWPWNKNSLSDGQKGIGRLKAEARIKHSEKPRGWLRRVISRSFELLIYPFKYAYMKVRRTDPWPRGRKSPGLERKIKHETQTPVSQEDLLRLLDGETFLGENASLMSRIEKTHGSLKSKFELILHGQKAEASKTITELTEELRIPLDSSAIHGYIIQFMREYALYPSSDIDLLGHLALCLGSLSSDKLTHITSDELHERVLKYTAMNLKRKVIDQISKSPEMVDPLIKGIFLPTEHIVQVTSKQLSSSTSFLAPKAHQIITADEEVLCDISPDVKSTKGDISVFLQAKRRAIKSLEEDQSLAEVDQSSLLFYLYILEKEFRSKYLVVPFRSKYLVVPQSNQNDAFQSDRLYIFPKELKTKLKNMSALVHRHIVEKLSASSISKS